MEPAAPRDALGDVIRTTLGGVAVRIGAVVGLAMFVAAGAVVFLLELLPIQTVQIALQVRFATEHLGTTQRVSNSLVGPWTGAVTESFRQGAIHLVLRQLWPTLFALAAIAVAGWYVRRMLPQLAARVVALLVAALTTSVLVFVTCVLLTYKLNIDGIRVSIEHPAARSFVETFVLIVAVGVFAFGLVSKLRQPMATVIGRAAAAFALVFAATAIIGGLAIAFGPSTVRGGSAFEPNAEEHVTAMNAGPAIAAAGLPLATFAKASFFAASDSFSPLVNSDAKNRGTQRVYWPAFDAYTRQHESGRLNTYADLAGTLRKTLLYIAAALAAVIWILATIGAIRRLGAPRSLDGLRLGALVGLTGGVLQLVAGWLATAWADTHFTGGSQTLLRWGATGEASFQALVVLVLLTGLTGLIYAAFRPAPTTYAPMTFRAPGWMTPPPAAPQASTPPPEPSSPAPEPVETPPALGPATSIQLPAASEAEEPSPEPPAPRRFCTSCGAAFPSDEARFCATCGAPRQDATT